MIKVMKRKCSIQGIYLNIIRSKNRNPTINIVQMEITEKHFHQVRNKTRMSTLSIPIPQYLKS